MLLLIIGITAVTLHFGIPLAYFLIIRKYLSLPWNLKIKEDYNPHVTVIIPTYNESKYIIEKLNDLVKQKYPKDKLKIIVVDSASTDGTPGLVKEWINKNKHLDVTLLVELERRGMIHALNYALDHVDFSKTDLIVFTDADSFWGENTLKAIAKYFSDPRVGAVTASITTTYNESIEVTYRNYYNTIRIGESKIHSTPVHNGALVAFRSKLLERIGRLPNYTGNNDSTPASLIAFMGYRAIQIPEALVREPVKTRGEFFRKIRRAQHLILHFLYTKKYALIKGLYKGRSRFDTIWKIEFYLNVINPWLLLLGSIFFFYALGNISIILLTTILLLTVIALGNKTLRTWVTYQIILSYAQLRNLKTKELVWQKT